MRILRNRYIRNGIITFVTTHLGKMIYDRAERYVFKVPRPWIDYELRNVFNIHVGIYGSVALL